MGLSPVNRYPSQGKSARTPRLTCLLTIHNRQSRGRKETPAITTPPPPPRVPPYENRTKPSETRKGPGKAGRKPARRQAEAEEFPWTRQLNYPEEKANAKWDMSIYDAVMLEEMRATRLRNGPIIEQIDSKLQETQRKHCPRPTFLLTPADILNRDRPNCEEE